MPAVRRPFMTSTQDCPVRCIGARTSTFGGVAGDGRVLTCHRRRQARQPVAGIKSSRPTVESSHRRCRRAIRSPWHAKRGRIAQ